MLEAQGNLFPGGERRRDRMKAERATPESRLRTLHVFLKRSLLVWDGRGWYDCEQNVGIYRSRIVSIIGSENLATEANPIAMPLNAFWSCMLFIPQLPYPRIPTPFDANASNLNPPCHSSQCISLMRYAYRTLGCTYP